MAYKYEQLLREPYLDLPLDPSLEVRPSGETPDVSVAAGEGSCDVGQRELLVPHVQERDFSSEGLLGTVAAAALVLLLS